jgi:predicted nucleic acid-binding protein
MSPDRPTEVSNGLLMALRKKRIKPGRFELFWDQLAALPIAVEAPISLDQTKDILALCERHGLTIYDGTYLELAKRMGFPTPPNTTCLELNSL